MATPYSIDDITLVGSGCACAAAVLLVCAVVARGTSLVPRARERAMHGFTYCVTRSWVSPALVAKVLLARAWLHARLARPLDAGDGMVSVPYVVCGLSRLAVVDRALASRPGLEELLIAAQPAHARIVFLYINGEDMSTTTRRFTNVNGYVHARPGDLCAAAARADATSTSTAEALDDADGYAYALQAVFADMSTAAVEAKSGCAATV